MTKILKILSLFLYNKRFSFIAIWLLLIVSSIVFLNTSKIELSENELIGAKNTEAFEVFDTIEKDFKKKMESSSALVLKTDKDLNFVFQELKNKFPIIKKVSEVHSNNKHEYRLIFIEYYSERPFVETQNLTVDLRKYAKTLESKLNTKVHVTGNSAFYHDIKDSGKKDSMKGEVIALIFSFFVLIFNFGAIVSALLPLIVGASTIIFSNAILHLLQFQVNPISQVMCSLVGLGIAIDYSLFIVSRFREELKKGKDTKEALSISLTNSGKTTLFSGLIMICSVCALIIPDVSSSRTVVINLIIYILISNIVSIIFLPVFLSLFVKLLNKPKFLYSIIEKNDNYKNWRSFSAHVVNHPKTYLIISSLILISLSTPAIYMKLWEPSQSLAPEESDSIQGYRLLEKDNWGGELVPIILIVKSTDKNVYDTNFINYVDKLTKFIQKNPNVSEVQSITSWNKDFNINDYINFYNGIYSFGLANTTEITSNLVNVNSGNNMTIINVYPKSLLDIEVSHNVINEIKEYGKQNTEFKLLTGGMVARARDFTKELYGYMPQMFFIIVIGIYILLFIYMKSIILPIKAAIMNFLPIISSFGVVTLIFQYGWFHNLLNTPINHAVTSMVPITLFCIIFGLSMDYEVLILSRISEAYEEKKDVKEAVIEGMAKSGSVITGAALILLVVFIPGIFSTSPGVKEICIGIISAIVIDATIVRLLLVPSFVVLMGKWNWWSPFKKDI